MKRARTERNKELPKKKKNIYIYIYISVVSAYLKEIF